jgi:hypothetical protein
MFRFSRLVRLPRALRALLFLKIQKNDIISFIKFTRKNYYAIAGLILALILSCAFLIFFLEHPVNSAFPTINSAIRWSFGTLVLVGYGWDKPLTFIGHLIAQALKLLGVLILAVIIGDLTVYFLERRTGWRRKKPHKARLKRS